MLNPLDLGFKLLTFGIDKRVRGQRLSAEASLEQAGISSSDLRLHWQRDDHGVTVTDYLTGVFGFGANFAEAISDLSQAMSEHREVLERQVALSPVLQDQLHYLRLFA
jgi:hypothetical protein